MNVPNKLTISRFVLTVVFLAVLYLPQFAWRDTIALLIFIVASLTDYFDGKIARQYNLITNFGILMDPLADKILVCSAYITFVGRGCMPVPAWMTVIIVARELVITGMRLLAASKNLVLAAERFGKHKTASQIAAIIALLVANSYHQWQTRVGLPPVRWLWLEMLAAFLLYLSVVLTFMSGAIYLWRNRQLYLVDL